MPRQQTVPARSRFQEALGKAIRSIRQERDLKQHELAHEAGVELGHLGEIERGQGNPTFETQVQIFIALETSFGRIGELIDEYLEGWGLCPQPAARDSAQISSTSPSQSASTSSDQP